MILSLGRAKQRAWERDAMTTAESFWRRCSSCKREIRFDVPYWTCSVSTCNRKGSSFVFCSVACWNAHVPTMRHRESWAEEQRAPTRAAWESRGDDDATAPAAAPSHGPLPAGEVPRDVLIVASKLKQYVRARSGMNTADSVIE